jgi:hypothetical protein
MTWMIKTPDSWWRSEIARFEDELAMLDKAGFRNSWAARTLCEWILC